MTIPLDPAAVSPRAEALTERTGALTFLRHNADRTLRVSGAAEVETHGVATPPCYGVVAMRSSGTLYVDTRTVHGRCNHYVVNSHAGGTLIEECIRFEVDAHPRCGER